jgi:hypothetical protein
MIKIYNSKEKREILIDDKASWVIITPMMHLEPPHIKIDLSGFFLFNHSSTCNDCKCFIDSFSKNSNDWFLLYNSKKYKINTENLGSSEFGSNQIKQTYFSEFEQGTSITLSLLELNIDELKKLIIDAVNEEEYEKCIIYRDLITEAEN